MPARDRPLVQSCASVARGGDCYTRAMTRRILITLALFALTAAVSGGMLHAQGSAESDRAPYRIDLHAGWNLISLPGDPADAALENVIGDAQVDVVLGYRGDAWQAAVRKPDGEWRTPSGFTTLSGGWGYWLHTQTAESLEVTLAPPDVPPALEVVSGWNLMGVWDEEQRLPGAEIGAEDYFSDIWWRVAYGYLKDENAWTKLLPDPEETVKTGAGYWVLVTTGGCLCP